MSVPFSTSPVAASFAWIRHALGQALGKVYKRDHATVGWVSRPRRKRRAATGPPAPD